MKRVLLTVAIIMVWVGVVRGETVAIQSDCVHLNEILGGGYPAVQVQCGFQPGDKKVLPQAVIQTALRRSGLTVESIASSYIVSRTGTKVDEEYVLQEITALYEDRYPEKKIKVEAVRFGRDIYLTPENLPRLTIDTSRFGSSSGSLHTGTNRYAISYTVKIYEEGYITSDRIKPGEDLENKLSLELIDVTNLKGSLVKNPAEVVAARALPKGRPLTTDMVDTRPERLKGDPITLIYDNGEIKIEVIAVAETNAVVGKSFLVKNPTSGKIFTAMYNGNGRATVN